MSQFLANLNNDILCAVDVETTGFEVGIHDIVQVAIIPVNPVDFKPHPKITPFILEMRPRYLENINYEALRITKKTLGEICNRSVDCYRGADMFQDWFDKLRLPLNKKIAPIGCNYSFDKAFLMEWLGPKTYENCFVTWGERDVQTVGNYLNDVAGLFGRDFPCPKLKLTYLATTLGLSFDGSAHDAVTDARMTALCWLALLKKGTVSI